MTQLAINATRRNSTKKSERGQLSLSIFGEEAESNDFRGAKHATFRSAKDQAFHRWYPYLEGYGPDFVRNIVATYMPAAKCILEPFVGSGTTSLALATMGITSGYCEANPVLRNVTRIKMDVARLPESCRIALSVKISALAKDLPKRVSRSQPDKTLLGNYVACFGTSIFFNERTYETVLNLRSLVDEIHKEDQSLADVLTLAVLAKLVICSNLKRAGDVRYKTKSELAIMPGSIVEEIQQHLLLMAEDCFCTEPYSGSASLICNDARQMESVSSFHADGVVTSPPYINGTNYIRNTKLELWFQRDLCSSSDLRKFRDMVVTAGINDVAGDQNYEPVSESVASVVEKLNKDAYDQRIPLMVAAYFADMLKVFRGIHRHTNPNAVVCIDIGDSKYGGVHVPTHSLLADVAKLAGFNLETAIPLRTRLSKDKTPLTQELLVFKKEKIATNGHRKVVKNAHNQRWEHFKSSMPHQQEPFTARNWGNPLHSLCSYNGKMKPSLAYHLINTFTEPGQSVLDPFSGAGTIPFEAALNGRRSYAIDISDLSFAISRAKLSRPNLARVEKRINELQEWIAANPPSDNEIRSAAKVQFNKPVPDYFHEKTLNEILAARRYFIATRDDSPEWALLLSSTLHILHGNRPYALSRRSHPITPFAPTGPVVYKSLIEKLKQKAFKSIEAYRPESFIEGQCFQTDSLAEWPTQVKDIDAIITSPPFYDSTRFYMTNWMRFWFCGWEREDFDEEPAKYLEQLQKSSLSIYRQLFVQAKNRLSANGLMVVHLGTSKKCDMGKELSSIGAEFFDVLDCYREDVQHCEKHGLSDKGTVTGHQYLIMRNR